MPGKWIHIVAGPNGAGKTTLAGNLLRDIPVINPDQIAAWLSPASPRRAAFAAGRSAIEELRERLDAGETFGTETTLSGRWIFRFMEAARAKGYGLELVYIGVEGERLAIQRVKERAEEAATTCSSVMSGGATARASCTFPPHWPRSITRCSTTTRRPHLKAPGSSARSKKALSSPSSPSGRSGSSVHSGRVCAWAMSFVAPSEYPVVPEPAHPAAISGGTFRTRAVRWRGLAAEPRARGSTTTAASAGERMRKADAEGRASARRRLVRTGHAASR